MALSTEQNSLVPAKENEVKTIVIKLPFDLQERILSFPFIHQIKEKYPAADLHFITPKKQIEVLNLLPFSGYYHEFDEDEIESIFDVHRYTATAKIYNVDLFISLTNSFVDACLGLGLRAKIRLGFSDGWKTLLLTHKTPRPQGHHISEDFFALLDALNGSVSDHRLKVMSRELVPVMSDWETNPYIAINLSPIRQAAIEDELAELIGYFENQKIVLFSSDDQDKVQLLIEPFIEKLSRKNNYVHFIHKNWIEMSKMLAFSRGLITFNGPVANLSSYLSNKTIILFDSEDPRRFGPFSFLGDSLILDVSDPSVALRQETSTLLKERKRFDMSEVFLRAKRLFQL